MARRWEAAAETGGPSDAALTAGSGASGDTGGLAAAVACAVVFLPARPPRAGHLALWRPDGGPLPDIGAGEGAAQGADGVAGPAQLTVARRHGNGARSRTVPAVLLPVVDAVPLLVRARHDPAAHPAAACWGAATLHALHLAARGKMLPGLTAEDTDAWRAGPLDPDDIAHLRAIAAAMPAEAYAVPLPGSRPLQLPDPAALVRLFVDAVADTLPRTPAAALVAGAPFAASAPQQLPGAREWAAEVAAGADAGVRLSLRLDLAPHRLFDTGRQDAGTDAGSGAEGTGDPDAAGVGARAGGGAEERGAAAVVLQVHSLTDPTLVADARDLWEGDGPDHFGPRSRVDTLLALRRAARVWPPLTRLLERPVPDVLPLGEDELYELLGEATPRLGAAGVTVHWPKELARGLTATAVLRPAPGSAADGFGFFDTDELLQFRWRLALDGAPLSEAEMDTLAEAHRPVVRLRDQWVLVDPALVRKARKRELGYLDPVDALAATLRGTTDVDGEEVEVVPLGALAALRSRLTADAHLLPQPPGLRATLRDYQLRGMAWLDTMTSTGLGGCLADDMGLGKTITVIALHLHRRPTAPVLVVCPASLLGNWQREIERFAPGTPVRRFHGTGRSLDGLTGGFVLTTYGTMRSSAAQLAARSWGWVVADEAQHVKNPRSSTAKALRGIKAPARIALTGTPVENNLSELWALLDWTTPGLLGPLKTFRALHAREVEGGEDPEAARRLARLVRPFILRRKKSDPGIAPELPPKTETDHPVALGREQAALYQAVVREALSRIEAAEGIARRGLVMKLLTALKQICNHPAQYLKEAAPGLAARSGKLELLDELLGTILAEGGATLVFTQYVGMARLLERHLDTHGIAHQFLHGGTPVAQREQMVDRFQSGHTPVFLLSLKAAGTGLNLTRAGHVIHYDRWWNPAVEEQATDRAYRIGQTQPVQVHRLIAEGTVEDNIAQLLTAKRALADAVLSGGEAALTELSDAELADLVSLRRPG
ncbi:DEAD/DEAH box helicase [Streptomyces kasugaensis]|uniref:DEAD/DEAH box helicase n=1 Tax=Streptomyces kasugaensis TaxID=1946 RepID=A0A4Q9HPC5_STRKA|nr:DEAD/DEAH box helicase [Streptomyces kasugaensis]TBO56525.1 DEAD/DEAH box helicase [Streptomyces kasugaensis]